VNDYYGIDLFCIQFNYHFMLGDFDFGSIDLDEEFVVPSSQASMSSQMSASFLGSQGTIFSSDRRSLKRYNVAGNFHFRNVC
jgi:hypothetical protein